MAHLHVLDWNVFHGRDHPPDRALFTLRSKLLKATERDATHVQVNRSLFDEFATLIAATPWSVCLLQEFPPRWAAPLAERCAAEPHVVLTSRNQLSPLRRGLARWNPDLLGSWEGGSNVTLVRAPWRIAGRGSVLLNPLPRRGLRERRRMALTIVAAERVELCIGNVHATAGDRAQAEEDVTRAAEWAAARARARPLLLGGDFNLRPDRSPVFGVLERRFGLTGTTAPAAIDHLLERGLTTLERPRGWPPSRREVPAREDPARTLRIRLSDHAPVEATFATGL